MTLSIAGRCARSGEFGVAISSSSPAVAARCAWARADVGAACTQNITDPRLGKVLLDSIANGDAASEAMAAIVQYGATDRLATTHSNRSKRRHRDLVGRAHAGRACHRGGS